MKKNKPKGDYPFYGNHTPEDRLEELELIALANTSGEEIENILHSVNPKLAKEYRKLFLKE